MSMSGIDLRSGLRKRSKSSLYGDRVEVGDAERVGDEAAGRRAAARADRDALALRPVGEVGDDQEVAGEAHLVDDRRARRRGARCRRCSRSASSRRASRRTVEALVEAARARRARAASSRVSPRRRLEDRELVVAELQLEVAALARCRACCRSPRGTSAKAARISSGPFT